MVCRSEGGNHARGHPEEEVPGVQRHPKDRPATDIPPATAQRTEHRVHCRQVLQRQVSNQSQVSTCDSFYLFSFVHYSFVYYSISG